MSMSSKGRWYVGLLVLVLFVRSVRVMDTHSYITLCVTCFGCTACGTFPMHYRFMLQFYDIHDHEIKNKSTEHLGGSAQYRRKLAS